MKARIVIPMILTLCLVLFALPFLHEAQANPPELTAMEQFGKALFFDKNLSINNNQSCADCHAPSKSSQLL